MDPAPADPQELRGDLPAPGGVHARKALQGLGGHAGQMLGEGAVVDQGGHLGKLLLDEPDAVPGPGRGGAVGLLGVQGLLAAAQLPQGQAALLQLRLHPLEVQGQHPGGVAEAPQVLQLLGGEAGPPGGGAGQGVGVVPHLADKAGGLLQLLGGEGQRPQGHLGGHGLPEDLGAQAPGYGGGHDIDALLQRRVHLLHGGDQLVKGVLVAVGHGPPVVFRLLVVHSRQHPQRQRRGAEITQGKNGGFSPLLLHGQTHILCSVLLFG